MHSTKLIVACLAVVVVAVVLFSVAVAVVTAAPSYPETAAIVIAEKGTVEVQRGGTGAWTKVEDQMDVEAGDRIRTGADSAGSVEYFDEGVSRLDANTEIAIESLSWDPVSGTLVGKVKLETGRLWSRLFNFLSPDSAYEVDTGSTVATVRGTAFFVAKGTGGVDTVFVDDHEVAVSVADGGSSRLVEAGGKVRVLQPVTGGAHVVFPSHVQELGELDFISRNRGLDREFHSRIMKKKQAELSGLRAVRPDSPLYGFVGLAERVRLAVTFNADQREALRRRFAMGRLVDAETILGADKDRATAILNTAIGYDADAELAFERLEGRKIFSFAEGWEKPSIEESGLVPGGRRTPAPEPSLEETTTVARTETDYSPSDSGPVESYTLEEGELVPLEPLYEPEQGSVPAAEPVTAELVVAADRPLINDTESSIVRAYLVTSDDAHRDVSAFVKWSVAVGPGSMEGNLFIPGLAGNSVVQATYVFEGAALTGTAPMRVFEAPKPEPEPDSAPTANDIDTSSINLLDVSAAGTNAVPNDQLLY